MIRILSLALFLSMGAYEYYYKYELLMKLVVYDDTTIVAMLCLTKRSFNICESGMIIIFYTAINKRKNHVYPK